MTRLSGQPASCAATCSVSAATACCSPAPTSGPGTATTASRCPTRWTSGSVRAPRVWPPDAPLPLTANRVTSRHSAGAGSPGAATVITPVPTAPTVSAAVSAAPNARRPTGRRRGRATTSASTGAHRRGRRPRRSHPPGAGGDRPSSTAPSAWTTRGQTLHGLDISTRTGRPSRAARLAANARPSRWGSAPRAIRTAAPSTSSGTRPGVRSTRRRTTGVAGTGRPNRSTIRSVALTRHRPAPTAAPSLALRRRARS